MFGNKSGHQSYWDFYLKLESEMTPDVCLAVSIFDPPPPILLWYNHSFTFNLCRHKVSPLSIPLEHERVLWYM